jgi:hypothetical protein
MGELVNMCENSFRFLNALFRIFGNQLVLHNNSDTCMVRMRKGILTTHTETVGLMF